MVNRMDDLKILLLLKRIDEKLEAALYGIADEEAIRLIYEIKDEITDTLKNVEVKIN